MSMCFYLKQADEITIELLHASPEKFDSFFWNEPVAETNTTKNPTIFSRFFNLSKLSSVKPSDSKLNNNGLSQDLDKSWQGIHYLLSGTEWSGDWPETFLLAFEEVIEGTDLGYGDAQVIRPKRLLEVVDFIIDINEEWLRDRYRPEQMTELGIYPETWDNPEEFEYLYENFLELKKFLVETKKNNLGVIMCLS